MGLLKRIKAGYEAITPSQLVFAKLTGNTGQVLGMLGVTIMTGILGYWWWVPFLFFTFLVLCVEWEQTRRQYARLRSVGRGAKQNGA